MDGPASSPPSALPTKPVARRWSFWGIVLALILVVVAVGRIAREIQRLQEKQEPRERARQAEEAQAEQTLGVWGTDEQREAALIEVFAAGGARIKVLRLECEDHRDPPVSTYEAEVEFLNDCQLKEGRTAFWSLGYHPGGGIGGKDSPMRPRGEPSVTQFKEGQRQVIRGFIDVNRPRDLDPAARKVLRDKNRISTGG